MIQIVEGPIRSGKSYYAVKYLYDYTKFDALYQEYKVADNVLIISNIEGLKCKHWKLDECLKKMPLIEFFTISNFETIMEKTRKSHIILVIDEAHELFPANFKDTTNSVYNFFAYSGHIGLDIFLLTQGIERLTKIFNPLLEFIVRVKPRTKQVLRQFSYDFVDLQGKFLYSKPVVKNKLVFQLYKSFRVDEKNKPKSAILHWVVIAVAIFAVAGGLFKAAFTSISHKQVKGAPPPVAVVLPSAPPVAVAAFRSVSSVSAPVPVPLPVISSVQSPAALALADLPRVLGFVGDSSGKNIKYLLSTGQIVECKRRLNIGDTYIR